MNNKLVNYDNSFVKMLLQQAIVSHRVNGTVGAPASSTYSDQADSGGAAYRWSYSRLIPTQWL